MKSQTVLFADLASFALPAFAEIATKKLNHPKIGNETYGRRSFIYVHFASYNERREIERKLTDKGHKVRDDYSPGKPVAEIQVSYFKGFHWDE